MRISDPQPRASPPTSPADALGGGADWTSVLLNVLALSAFAALGAVFASFAFRKYQQSM